MNAMNRYFNSKVRAVLLLSAIPYVWMQSASADCTPMNGWQNKMFNITIPKIVIPRDAPIGTTLFSQTVNFPNQEDIFRFCVNGTAEVYARYKNGWTPDSSGVAPTNLPGIGIKITDRPNAQAATYYRAANSSIASKTFYPYDDGVYIGRWNNDGFSIQLVKTGPTSVGSLNTGIVAGLALKNLYWMTAIQIVDGGSFSTSGCTVSTKSLTVPLGSFKRSEFSGVGSTTQTNTFKIVVDCIESTYINMTLSATADSSSAPGVIAIDSTAGVTTAKGVGIQLLLYNKPVAIGSSFYVGRATVTGGNSIEMAARYYQTKSTVTAGQANATATFTLTYN
ncbi:fimbrial protein [Pseudomonas shahriarae]|uniref:fimbrial protein n=1 Tax=Pseudomonas shahriarae TaxID=2745512 RepID=UPI00235ED641|nr:fimbrial protein [Pseudomonas shahriarae]MDD1134188.1 fimbrial protein [Pseudomonas shahriarae]